MIGLKRFLALALSAAMSLSLCAPAMASGGGGATEEGGGEAPSIYVALRSTSIRTLAT